MVLHGDHFCYICNMSAKKSKNAITDRLNDIKRICVERGFCYKNGNLKKRGNEYLKKQFETYAHNSYFIGWCELWCDVSLWVPYPSTRKKQLTKEEIFRDDDEWGYKAIKKLTDKDLDNFCTAIEIFTESTPIFLNDDDMCIL